MRQRLLREILTTQPMRRLITLINGWYALILTVQVGRVDQIASMRILRVEQPEWFWVTLWWSLTVLSLITIFVRRRSFIRVATILSAIAWVFNAWYLAQYDRYVLPMTGFSLIFAFMGLWSFMRTGHVPSIVSLEDIYGGPFDTARIYSSGGRRAADAATRPVDRASTSAEAGRSPTTNNEAQHLVHGEGYRDSGDTANGVPLVVPVAYQQSLFDESDLQKLVCISTVVDMASSVPGDSDTLNYIARNG